MKEQKIPNTPLKATEAKRILTTRGIILDFPDLFESTKVTSNISGSRNINIHKTKKCTTPIKEIIK
jgi:hypothetical protein